MVEKVLQKMIEYFNGDVKRTNHSLKVYTLARSMGIITKMEKRKMLSLEIAAILHDIGIKESERKYGSPAGRYQEIEGPPVAAELLEEFNLEEDILSRVCYLIGNHHSY